MWAQGTGPAVGVEERLMAAVGGSALLAASLQRCSRAVASSEAELRALGLFHAAFDALGPARCPQGFEAFPCRQQ